VRIGRENRSAQIRFTPMPIFFATNPEWPELGSNSCRRGTKPGPTAWPAITAAGGIYSTGVFIINAY
jgi:hypothetical protein